MSPIKEKIARNEKERWRVKEMMIKEKREEDVWQREHKRETMNEKDWQREEDLVESKIQ